MSNKKDLKAFVRYDGTGRIIPGSLILQRSKPKVGDWQQIDAYECCNPTTSTTTTSISFPETLCLSGETSLAGTYTFDSLDEYGYPVYTNGSSTLYYYYGDGQWVFQNGPVSIGDTTYTDTHNPTTIDWSPYSVTAGACPS